MFRFQYVVYIYIYSFSHSTLTVWIHCIHHLYCDCCGQIVNLAQYSSSINICTFKLVQKHIQNLNAQMNGKQMQSIYTAQTFTRTTVTLALLTAILYTKYRVRVQFFYYLR